VWNSHKSLSVCCETIKLVDHSLIASVFGMKNQTQPHSRESETSGQGNLTKGRIAAAHWQFNAFASPYLISWRSVKLLQKYRDFSIFKMAAVHHIDCWKDRYLNARLGGEVQSASPCQTSWQSVKPLPTYRDFPAFKMVAVRHLGFVNVRIFETKSCSQDHFAAPCQISWRCAKPLQRYGDSSNMWSPEPTRVHHQTASRSVKPFLATVCMLSDRCLSVLSLPVCDVGVLWRNGWVDQDATWHGGRPQPMPYC